jgi:dynein heavy chain 1, cytosolic
MVNLQLLHLLRSGQLQEAYQAIDARLGAVGAYVAVWLQYQALWDLEPAQVYARLGDDLARWQRLLADIRAARATFDNNDTRRVFGTVVVDYAQVQGKVNAKYDFWQREIVTRFGQRLGAALADLFGQLARARADLEEQSLESDNTADAVAFITFIGDVKRRLGAWTAALETCRGGQKLLERQRFQFPTDWLYFDNVQGEWSAFNEILARKDALLQGQIGALPMPPETGTDNAPLTHTTLYGQPLSNSRLCKRTRPSIRASATWRANGISASPSRAT